MDGRQTAARRGSFEAALEPTTNGAPKARQIQENLNGSHHLASTARSRGRARLRRAGLQHQQHGAGAGHHGGRLRARRARHHPGLARRALLRQRRHAQAHDGRGHRNLSADSGLRASRPRQRARHLHDRDPGRLHLGHDGRLAEGRRQDPRRLGLQCRRDQDRHRHGPSRRHLGGRRTRRARLARDRHGRQGRRPRRRRQALARPVADQSRTKP